MHSAGREEKPELDTKGSGLAASIISMNHVRTADEDHSVRNERKNAIMVTRYGGRSVGEVSVCGPYYSYHHHILRTPVAHSCTMACVCIVHLESAHAVENCAVCGVTQRTNVV